MKLQHFYSDWNGLRSKEPYLRKPLASELAKAKPLYKRGNGTCIIVGDGIVEVKAMTGDISRNMYRDMYKILESK